MNNTDNNIMTYTKSRDPKKRISKDELNLKFCIKCKTVWERFHYRTSRVNKYQDMPTYGIPRKDCDECREG